MDLKKLIQEKYPGLSIRKFAEKANLPPTTIYGIIERGTDKLRVGTLINIANALEVSILDIVPNAFDKYTNALEQILLRAQIINSENGIYQFDDEEESEPFDGYVELKNEDYFEIDYFNTMHFDDKTKDYGNVIYTVKLPKILFQLSEAHNNNNGIDFNKVENYKIVEVFNDSVDRVFKVGDKILLNIFKKDDLSDELENGDIVIYKYKNKYDMRFYRVMGNKMVLSANSSNNNLYDLVIDFDDFDEPISFWGKVLFGINRT